MPSIRLQRVRHLISVILKSVMCFQTLYVQCHKVHMKFLTQYLAKYLCLVNNSNGIRLLKQFINVSKQYESLSRSS